MSADRRDIGTAPASGRNPVTLRVVSGLLRAERLEDVLHHDAAVGTLRPGLYMELAFGVAGPFVVGAPRVEDDVPLGCVLPEPATIMAATGRVSTSTSMISSGVPRR